MKSAATPRWVSGIPAIAGAASAELMPGTTVTGTPAATQASHSSPPRPNTNGSPPLSRTTRLPARARSTMNVVDLVLAEVVPVRRLAAVDHLDAGRQFVEQRARREPVDHHHVGRGDQPPPAHRDQVGIARAAADQRHRPRGRRTDRPHRQLAQRRAPSEIASRSATARRGSSPPLTATVRSSRRTTAGVRAVPPVASSARTQKIRRRRGLGRDRGVDRGIGRARERRARRRRGRRSANSRRCDRDAGSNVRSVRRRPWRDHSHRAPASTSASAPAASPPRRRRRRAPVAAGHVEQEREAGHVPDCPSPPETGHTACATSGTAVHRRVPPWSDAAGRLPPDLAPPHRLRTGGGRGLLMPPSGSCSCRRTPVRNATDRRDTRMPARRKDKGQWALGYREPLNPNERSKRDNDGLARPPAHHRHLPAHRLRRHRPGRPARSVPLVRPVHPAPPGHPRRQDRHPRAGRARGRVLHDAHPHRRRRR